MAFVRTKNMRFVTLFLLIFVAILATNAKPVKTKRTLRLPLSRVDINTTAVFDRRATSTLPLKHPRPSKLYTTQITIGTPPQTFNLMVNTGFPDVILGDKKCVNWNCRDIGNQYDGGASSTFKDLNQPYVDGDFSGTWTQDVFDFLGTPFQRIFSRGWQVPLSWVKLGTYSGIFGLGLHRDPPHDTLVDYLSTAKMFDDDLISIRLVKDTVDNAGDLLFGDAEEEKYVDGLIQYTRVVSGPTEWHWQIPILDIQINHKSVGHGTAAIDSGYEHVFLTTGIVDELYRDTGAVRQKDGMWAVPDPFPHDVAFIIGNREFTVRKEDVPLKGDNFKQYDGLYTGAIQVSENNDQNWYLGIPFFWNNYIVLDYTKDDQNVGIGKLKR